MADYPDMKMPRDGWVKSRHTYHRFLKESKRFQGGEGGKRTYHTAFAVARWRQLPVSEMKQHRRQNCLRCVRMPEFGLKTSNREYITALEPQARQPERHQQQPQRVNETTPHHRPRRTNLTIADIPERTLNEIYKNIPKDRVPKKVVNEILKERMTLERLPIFLKRQIIGSAKKSQQKKAAIKDLNSIFLTNNSFRKHNCQRALQFGSYLQHKRRSHIGQLDTYEFNRQLARDAFVNVAEGGLNLGMKMDGKWYPLAKRCEVRKRIGPQPKSINGGQVIQAYAASLGYEFSTRKHQRVTWDKHDGIGLAVYRTNHDSVLKRLRDDMIEKGAIDIGHAVCPTVSHKMRINQDTGDVVDKETEVFGRKISIMKIRRDHLKLMKRKGLLRNTDVFSMSEDDLAAILRKYKVPYSEQDSDAILRDKVISLETTRHLNIWQDHSDIGGHSHYVITVSFLYDEAVYKTKEELGFDVQSVVERPYLHFIGRSKSSVEDQLIYIPERTDELIQCQVPIQLEDRVYIDVVRFNTGDLPARQYESGNAGGGSFPCACGRHSDIFRKPDKLFLDPPYICLQDRIDVIKSARDPAKGIDPNNINKADAKEELSRLGVTLAGDEKADELRDLLQCTLKGIRRLPAVCACGKTLEELNLDRYEVTHCDPLHDFKNVIVHLFDELPSQINDADIRKEISHFCTTSMGEARNIKASDARQYLVNLGLLLENMRFQRDPQMRKVGQMVRRLTELQRLAYQTSDKRTTRDVLRFHLQALLFSVVYTELFKEPKKVSKRAMFGAPYHSIVCHMPQLYRIVSLRSIVTESSERIFSELKQMTAASNKQASNVIKNIMIRTHFATEAGENRASEKFLREQTRIDRSAVSLASCHLRPADRTILDSNFITKNQTATRATFKLIADFILPGPGQCYYVENGHIIFFDGPNDVINVEGIELNHYRDTMLADIAKFSTNNWRSCLKKAQDLDIDLIKQLQPQLVESENISVSNQELHETHMEVDDPASFKDESRHLDLPSESTSCPNVTGRGLCLGSEKSLTSPKPDQVESSVPKQNKAEVKDVMISESLGRRLMYRLPVLPTESTSRVQVSVKEGQDRSRYQDASNPLKQDHKAEAEQPDSVRDNGDVKPTKHRDNPNVAATENPHQVGDYQYMCDAFIDAWRDANLPSRTICQYLERRSAAKKLIKSRSLEAQKAIGLYQKVYGEILPYLHKLSIDLEKKVSELEREFYKKHRKVATNIINKRLDAQHKAVCHYMVP